ncbi:hypothetical protein FGADI_12900 [Fusarium gaditjirri]|uniref:Cytochrome P450 monooxygenase n=1 Tax=Fusarium gaditjirri TaxID=282569 RepID=A0A8H4SR01_9HYPO|nr:hypothetical protein FGADI_12900 [Fusarium gaditjirri]
MSVFVMFAFGVGCCLLLVRLVTSYLRLSNIPGPLAAKFTDLWCYKLQNSKAYSSRLVELHNNTCDPAAIPIIYSINPTWIKGPSYYGAIPVSKNRPVPSIIGMGEAQYTAVRKSVGRAFTTNSLLDYEDSIEATGKELIAVLSHETETDIGEWLQYFAMDMLIRISFGDSLGMLSKRQDVDGTLQAVMARFDHWGQWGAVPSIDYAVNKSRLATTLRGVRDHPLARVAQSKLDTRKRDENKSSYRDLCSKFLEGQKKYPQLVKQDEILGIIISTIGAGADTTVSTLTYTLYFLSKHPAARQKLIDEINENLSQGTLSRTPK